jgi:endonuclease III-like uncharacterized protein
MNKKSTVLEDLIISILSVNNVSIDKTYSHIESMRKEGIFDPLKLSKLSIEDIGNNLKKAGYDRGGVNYIIAERLLDLGKKILSEGQDNFEKNLSDKNKSSLKDFLLSLRGVGNKVVDNFFVLRDLK